MQMNVERIDIFECKADLAVIPVWSDEFSSESLVQEFPPSVSKPLLRQAKLQEFTGAFGQLLSLTSNDDGHHNIIIVGLGGKKEFILETAREWAGIVVSAARKLGAKTMVLGLPGEGLTELDVRGVGEAVAVALELADYAFDTFKKNAGEKRLKSVTIIVKSGRDVARARKGVERGLALASGVTVARDLVNMPAQAMTPAHLAEAAERIAKAGGKQLKVKILDREQCQKLGMGAFLAVAQGADNPPKFIHLTYKPIKPSKKIIAVVGKGVTFDSGGLSIKPADAMMTMKCDMAGAAAVLGLFAVLPALAPRAEVHGLIAATENMPSGKAIRPGDVVKASSGKTIEVLNTDAEGRLTLADALTYAVKLKPTAIIDLATLTGACLVALGEEITGLMSNDRSLANKVLEASRVAGEKMWEMPLERRYRPLIESEIADLRNIPTTRYGGSLTAGLFLQEFVDDLPWVHLDIAGPAFAEKPIAAYLARGGTGHGVRTLAEYLSQI